MLLAILTRFAIALGLAATLLGVGVSGSARLVATTPEQAIANAVAERMGGDVTVRVTDIDTTVVGEPGLEAQLDPTTKVGRPARFVLTRRGVRKGAAVATVRVEARYLRAARAIARDEVITRDAYDVITGELPAMTLRRVPAEGDVTGLKARRAIAVGEVLTDAVLVTPPAVRSGEEVSVKVAIGRVEVTGTAVASGSGQPGDMIQIMQPHSRRLMKARIVGPGMVEVVR